MAIAAAVMGVVRGALEDKYGVTVAKDYEERPFDNPAFRESVSDIFVSKYDAHGVEGQGPLSGLEVHRDGSLGYSWVLLLNEGFGGGGTCFSNYLTDEGTEVVFRGGMGSFIVFPGWVQHGALSIEATLSRAAAMSQRKDGRVVDVRYVMAGFMKTRQLHAERPYQPLREHQDTVDNIIESMGTTGGGRCDVLLTRFAACDDRACDDRGGGKDDRGEGKN